MTKTTKCWSKWVPHLWVWLSLLLWTDLQGAAVIGRGLGQPMGDSQVARPGVQTQTQQQPRVLPLLVCRDRETTPQPSPTVSHILQQALLDAMSGYNWWFGGGWDWEWKGERLHRVGGVPDNSSRGSSLCFAILPSRDSVQNWNPCSANSFLAKTFGTRH